MQIKLYKSNIYQLKCDTGANFANTVKPLHENWKTLHVNWEIRYVIRKFLKVIIGLKTIKLPLLGAATKPCRATRCGKLYTGLLFNLCAQNSEAPHWPVHYEALKTLLLY